MVMMKNMRGMQGREFPRQLHLESQEKTCPCYFRISRYDRSAKYENNTENVLLGCGEAVVQSACLFSSAGSLPRFLAGLFVQDIGLCSMATCINSHGCLDPTPTTIMQIDQHFRLSTPTFTQT